MSDMEAIDRRLDSLEAENAALRAEIAALKQGRRVIPAPVERSVVIATPPPVSTFPMPTAAELSQLIDAVGRRFSRVARHTRTGLRRDKA